MEKYIKLIYNQYLITNMKKISLDNSHKKTIIQEKNITNEIIDLSNFIDKKCVELYDTNQTHNENIEKYQLMMENIILEYHKICKKLFE